LNERASAPISSRLRTARVREGAKATSAVAHERRSSERVIRRATTAVPNSASATAVPSATSTPFHVSASSAAASACAPRIAVWVAA